MEKALAEHVACHPEDAGRTVKDFNWIEWEIVRNLSAAEISEAEISAAAARNEITKGKIEDEFKSIPLDGPSETPEPINPDRPAHSGPWRPVHQRPAYQRPIRGNWRTA